MADTRIPPAEPGAALLRAGRFFRPGAPAPDLHSIALTGGREADAFYRDRWSHDKVVNSTHGVNCTGSCRWKVYVKDGIITWETQQTDYPSVGKFLRATDPGQHGEGAEWKTVVLDAASGRAVVPNGSPGFRWTESGKGRWNLELGPVEPTLSLYGHDVATGVEVPLPRFDTEGCEHGQGRGDVVRRGVPATRLGGRNGPLVTTVYDLLLAQYGVQRSGLPGSWPASYEDADAPGTAAWQEVRTSVPTRGGRHRARRPGPVPGLADVRDWMPVQEGVLQPPHRQGREVHAVLPAGRDRAAPVCSETRMGRLRCLGVALYDADKVTAAASVPDEKALYGAQLGVFLDPEDHAVQRAAEEAGIPYDWMEAARRSPVHALIGKYRVALPLHPEYRTMPMVWYIPPLSPVVDALTEAGHDGEDAGNLFGAIDTLRIPLEYLAEMFTAGDTAPVRASLEKLAAMRSHMRAVNLGEEPDEAVTAAVGMQPAEIEEMYRLLAIAKYEDRYVIPTAAVGDARRLEESPLPEGCSLDYEGGPGMGGDGPFGQDSGRRRLPLESVENFHALRRSQTTDETKET